MEIKTIGLSDNEVATAVRMFADDNWEYAMYNLKSLETLAEDNISPIEFIKSVDKSELPQSLIDDVLEFINEFTDDVNWIVYILYTEDEFCGLIAFKDWCHE